MDQRMAFPCPRYFEVDEAVAGDPPLVKLPRPEEAAFARSAGSRRDLRWTFLGQTSASNDQKRNKDPMAHAGSKLPGKQFDGQFV